MSRRLTIDMDPNTLNAWQQVISLDRSLAQRVVAYAIRQAGEELPLGFARRSYSFKNDPDGIALTHQAGFGSAYDFEPHIKPMQNTVVPEGRLGVYVVYADRLHLSEVRKRVEQYQEWQHLARMVATIVKDNTTFESCAGTGEGLPFLANGHAELSETHLA